MRGGDLISEIPFLFFDLFANVSFRFISHSCHRSFFFLSLGTFVWYNSKVTETLLNTHNAILEWCHSRLISFARWNRDCDWKWTFFINWFLLDKKSTRTKMMPCWWHARHSLMFYLIIVCWAKNSDDGNAISNLAITNSNQNTSTTIRIYLQVYS